jgi:hypothetical protein
VFLFSVLIFKFAASLPVRSFLVYHITLRFLRNFVLLLFSPWKYTNLLATWYFVIPIPVYSFRAACSSASGLISPPESLAMLPPFGPIEGQKLFDQISSPVLIFSYV